MYKYNQWTLRTNQETKWWVIEPITREEIAKMSVTKVTSKVAEDILHDGHHVRNGHRETLTQFVEVVSVSGDWFLSKTFREAAFGQLHDTEIINGTLTHIVKQPTFEPDEIDEFDF